MNHEKRKDKNIPRIKENYLVCPVIVDIRPPSSKFHSLMLLSSEQEATTLSSG